jgi:hypothetical protein
MERHKWRREYAAITFPTAASWLETGVSMTQANIRLAGTRMSIETGEFIEIVQSFRMTRNGVKDH